MRPLVRRFELFAVLTILSGRRKLVEAAADAARAGSSEDRYLRSKNSHELRDSILDPQGWKADGPVGDTEGINAFPRCGCNDCTEGAWNTLATTYATDNYTCGSRIEWLIENDGMSDADACRKVAGTAFPFVCGPWCDPDRCDNPPTNRSVPATTRAATTTTCGCQGCTNGFLSSNFAVDSGGNYSCGDRIDWVIGNTDYNERGACSLVAGSEFPTVCGPLCDPDRCQPSADTPSSPPPLSPRCGCQQCSQAWNNVAANAASGSHTCGERIQWVIDNTKLSEVDACVRVASVEFPTICGPQCDPSRCNVSPNQATPSPTQAPTKAPTAAPTPTPTSRCGCKQCTVAMLARVADNFTCGARINWLVKKSRMSEKAARAQVASVEYPAVCGPACDPNQCTPTQGLNCGCNDCVDSVWNAYAADETGNFTCGSRIEWLMASSGLSLNQACTQVANNEFPLVCGPGCNPQRCDGRKPVLTAFPTLAPHSPPLTATTSQYCFPEYPYRERYTNVWGNYTVEVKESANGALCGPGDNSFSRDTVSLTGNELKLQFKYINGVWQGSEVRVVLPDQQMPYTYGTYWFSVKNITHWNTATNTVVSNELPPSLVLGLFTWDSTEIYDVHENWNHEVDVEISRWGIVDNQDAQFLVQPPALPQWYRFDTGPANGTRDEAGHIYGFTWNPGKIRWFTNAGGGLTHVYTTRDAVLVGYPDRIQCLPANVEIRMNLWNSIGTTTPMEMTVNDRVDVIIDSFRFSPSGLTHLSDGDYCTKHCQCAPTSLCQNGLCTPK